MIIESFKGRLLSKQSAATACDCSIAYLDRLIASGDISVIRISPKMTRIDGDSLAMFLMSRAEIRSRPRGCRS